MNKQLKTKMGRLCYGANDSRLTPYCQKLFGAGLVDALDAHNLYVRGVLDATEYNLNAARNLIRAGKHATAREILLSVVRALVSVAEQQGLKRCA